MCVKNDDIDTCFEKNDYLCTRQIEERAPAVRADTHFFLRAKEYLCIKICRKKQGLDFNPTISRHAKTDASIVLGIWLNERVLVLS